MYMSDAGLDRLFNPRSVAVLGASTKEGKVGYELLKNLILGGYEGEIYPVNPKGGSIFNLEFYRDPHELPEDIDLALIALPGDKAIESLKTLAYKGLGGAVVYAAGFEESGDMDRVRELKNIVDETGVRVIGPNCAGFIYGGSRLYAGFVPGVEYGDLGLISQSGAFSAVVNTYLRSKGLGLKLLATLGNRADVSEADIIRYFSDSIPVYMLYIEGLPGLVGRELAYSIKSSNAPVVVLKGGVSMESGRALMSHTASVAGDYMMFRDIIESVGGYVVRDYIELVDVAESVYRLDPPSGVSVAIVTNGGGPAVILMDHLSGGGLRIDNTPREIVGKLGFLRKYMNRGNPIDLTADGDEDLYYHTISILMKDSWPDIIVSIHVPPSLIDPYKVMKSVADAYVDSGGVKPLIPLFMGVEMSEYVRILGGVGLPTPTTHRSAAESIKYLVMRREAPPHR